jgi:hypothetical protein
MNPRVVHAKACSPTAVSIIFTNGDHGVLDVSRYLQFPVFAPLRDPGFFARVHADRGTVVWSDELDLCPDTVWADTVRDLEASTAPDHLNP